MPTDREGATPHSNMETAEVESAWRVLPECVTCCPFSSASCPRERSVYSEPNFWGPGNCCQPLFSGPGRKHSLLSQSAAQQPSPSLSMLCPSPFSPLSQHYPPPPLPTRPCPHHTFHSCFWLFPSLKPSPTIPAIPRSLLVPTHLSSHASP